MLTVSFHWSQYCSNKLSICCRSSLLLLNKTVSSAKRRRRSFIYVCILSVFASQTIPFAPFAKRKASRSFRKNENKIGDKFSPWRTPLLHGKYAEFPSWVTILDFMLLYMLLTKFSHFPLMLYFCSLNHNTSRQTLSNACLKSTKAQKSLFLHDFEISNKLCSINKLSEVESPLRNPAWLWHIISYFSA